MGTFITAVGLIAIISLIVRSMIHDKKNGKSLQCGIGCKNCGGRCHNTTLQIKKEDKK